MIKTMKVALKIPLIIVTSFYLVYAIPATVISSVNFFDENYVFGLNVYNAREGDLILENVKIKNTHTGEDILFIGTILGNEYDYEPLNVPKKYLTPGSAYALYFQCDGKTYEKELIKYISKYDVSDVRVSLAQYKKKENIEIYVYYNET